MSKIKFKDDFGLGSIEACLSILNALKKEGFDEDRVLGFVITITEYTQDKKTIHKKEIFEKKVEEIIKEYKEELKNDDYFEAYKEIQKLFRDKKEGKTRRFINKNSAILTFTIPSFVTLLVFVIELIIKYK